MASQSSTNPIICASFNQDNSCFVIGTRDGFKIFDSSTGRLLYERAMGALIIIEMLFSTSLLAIVGAGEQPSLSPRRLVLFNTTSGAPLRELNFLTSVVAVRLNKQRLIVVLQEKTYIYDINTLAILDTIDTVHNTKGICAFSPSLDGCFLALPASTTRGSVLLFDVTELRPHCEIDAHRSPLAAMVLTSNGMYLATASEQGTLVRVYLVSEATKSFSFRRGTYSSTIFSLSFGPSPHLPDFVAATSSSGTVHIFHLRLAVNQRGIRSNSFLGSVLPDSVNDVLDPAYHLILHNAFPSGMKSYVMIRKVEKELETSSSSEFVPCKALVTLITFNGYFQEYSLNIDDQNTSSWVLEREFNLLTVESPKTVSRS